MAHRRQLLLDIRPDSPPDFDSFVAGANGEVLAALGALARGELREPVVYLWGPMGSGRTHLLRATLHQARHHGLAALQAEADDLPDDMPRLLVVDDVESLDPNAQVRLFSLLNLARERGATVLAGGASAPAQLPLRPDLATRLGWGLIFALRPLNEAERAAALRERAAARGLGLTDEVLRYLLTHLRRDLPTLLASIDALDRYTLSLQRPLTVPLVREWLRER